jgi:DNA-binding Lrp family transcriptional regulator
MVTWRAYDLDLKDYEIFLSLKKNPLQSNAEIGRSVALSSESVRSRVHVMKSKGFLRANGEINDPVLGPRQQTESTGVYNPTALGLLRQHVIFKGIPDRQALNDLKRMCNDHPYTHYRAPAYGDSASLYVQFDIPPETSKTMQRFYDALRKKRLFSTYFVLDAHYYARCGADFSKWDAKRDAWNVDCGKKAGLGSNLSGLEDIWSGIQTTMDDYKAPEVIPEARYDFDSLDLRLLRELTIASKPVLTAISAAYANDPNLADEFKKDATTLGRRVSKIRENIVTRDQLYYDRRVFDLTYPQLISGEFKAGSDLSSDSLYRFVSSNALPFETAAHFDKKSFLLYSTTTPSIAPELSELIWDHAQAISVYQLQLDASALYFFYQENYANGKWNTDRQYISDGPLSRI